MTHDARLGIRGRLLAGAALILAVGAGLLFAASPAAASEPAPDPRAATFEIDFLSETIDHHEMAIRMAQICLEKAVHPELRELCERNIEMQEREQSEMQAWLVDWYGFDPSSEEVQANLTPEQQQQLEMLASIHDPAQFEIAFMEMLIEHHKRGIEMAEMCLEEAYHHELKALCEEIIVAQSKDIRQLEQWLCEWYGRCHREPGHQPSTPPSHQPTTPPSHRPVNQPNHQAITRPNH